MFKLVLILLITFTQCAAMFDDPFPECSQQAVEAKEALRQPLLNARTSCKETAEERNCCNILKGIWKCLTRRRPRPYTNL